MSINLTHISSQVQALAIEVGRFQVEQRKHFQLECVESKHSHDYVSYVDKESEKMIVARLREILPEARFITEEGTTLQAVTEESECSQQIVSPNDSVQQTASRNESSRQTSTLTWIVDPLDGTTNYVHDMAPSAVCIALADGSDYLLGVVYETSRDELFYATKGGGAWLKHGDEAPEPLHVSQISDIDQALVMIGYPYDADAWRQFCLDITDRLYGHCASIRSYGSAESELCYVAAGRIDIYFESFIQPWDVAAGACILLEAGGRLTDYQGGDDLWRSGRQVLATNGTLHDAIVREIQAALSC